MPATLDKTKYSSFYDKLLKNALTEDDVQVYKDSITEGMMVKLITDIWTPRGQIRRPVIGWVHRKYKHFCTIVFYWENCRGATEVYRQITYREMLICKRRNILPLADMRNKGLIEEVEK